jgi:hypothetical protein|uniref:Uncharacterized protein n=1 Tax=Myoviridae sp. ctx322 TaxID=2826711 RepID=A0A8S5NA91_9CAUD|nr:MAG TPA: hypothetical protein [Myoviridae sp. ctx322]
MAKTLDAAGVKRLIQEIKGANKNLNAPIPISTENTPESMAQNVKNIADYVAKAKAAGIVDVNGMAVSCIINNNYSGVGYLYGDTSICGIETDNGLEAPFFFVVDPDGSYGEGEVLVKGLSDQITSDMLVEGARKPIILTSNTTEVDEETYQKLLSDDVDVVFKTADGYYLPFQSRDVGVKNVDFYFSFIRFDASAFSAPDTTIESVYLSIKKTAPHVVNQTDSGTDFDKFLRDSNFIHKSTLSPVLKQIDLRGTDADRKAKLDKFEMDWKALTGASDLRGARFVGYVENTDNSGTCSVLFTFDYGSNTLYQGCVMASDADEKIVKYTLYKDDGSLALTPLFSHLEAITIYTNNTPEHMQANLDNIAAYEANLQALGVDVTKGWNAPASFSSGDFGTLFHIMEGEYYSGIMVNKNTVTSPYSYGVRKSDGYFYRANIITQASTIYSLTTTTSKKIVGAINEVNALAKGYSTIFTPIELTTETAQNKTAIDARMAAFTAQGISLTNGCCIPVTYKGVYAGNISLINGDWYGLLVKNTNNPADNINIKLSADGTITEGNSAQ